MCIKFRPFWKKEWVSYPNHFRNYCFRKRLLLERLEGPPPEHHSVINLLTGSKRRWKMQGRTIILFSHEFQVNGVGKSLLYSDLKSSDFLLTHWLPMTSIPGTISRNFCNNLKRYFLKTEDFFWIFYCISEMFIKIGTFWKKGWVS